MSPETRPPRRTLLRPRDQGVIAAAVAIGMTILLAQRISVGLSSFRQVDIRRVEKKPVQFLVDINQASWPEIAQLPDVGETLARRVVESRKREGPFQTVSDLRRVRGFGQVKFKRIEPYLSVGK